MQTSLTAASPAGATHAQNATAAATVDVQILAPTHLLAPAGFCRPVAISTRTSAERDGGKSAEGSAVSQTAQQPRMQKMSAQLVRVPEDFSPSALSWACSKNSSNSGQSILLAEFAGVV